MLINAASASIEAQTGRKFGRADYAEKYEAPDSQQLPLRQYPIRQVYSVVDLTDGGEIPPESYDAEVFGYIGCLYKNDAWQPQYYRRGLAYDPVFSKRYLKVSYQAGYILPKDATDDEPSDLPYDLQLLVWQMAAQQWTVMTNGAYGLSAFSISDVSWTFDKSSDQGWQNVINVYRRYFL
jgi:hypothetical protein